MLIQKAFQYELRPDGVTRRAFSRFAGAKRFVWNRALGQPKWLGRFKMNPILKSWKQELPWLYEIHSQVLQSAIVDLDTAFQKFFKKEAEHPVPKLKGKCQDTFRFPQGFKIEEGNRRLYLPKIGWVRYRNSRALRGVAKNITISRRGDKWFASIQTEFEVEEPIHPSTSSMGIDLGVVRFATLSDETFVEPLNALKKQQAKLKKLQQSVSRKKKRSQNWKKAKAKVAKLHQAVANSRKDFLHKLTTDQTKTHSLILIEDLKVANMSRSASGTLDEPGKMVKQKSGLNKSILDQGWSEYRRQLEYKMKWRGGEVIAVPAMNTSRRCPACDHISKDNRKSQASFLCVECGFAANADLVGAVNIKRSGLRQIEGQDTADASAGRVSAAQIACEVNREVSGQQQEPAKKTAKAA